MGQVQVYVQSGLKSPWWARESLFKVLTWKAEVLKELLSELHLQITKKQIADATLTVSRAWTILFGHITAISYSSYYHN